MAKILNIDGAKLNIDSTNLSDKFVLETRLWDTDLNTVAKTGVYNLTSSVTNLPTTGAYVWGTMLVLASGGDTGTQILFSVYGSPPAFRSWTQSGSTLTFSDWFYLSQTT